MQPLLERGSIDKPLTFDVGLIQLSFIPVCSPNTCNISVKLRRGFAFHCNIIINIIIILSLLLLLFLLKNNIIVSIDHFQMAIILLILLQYFVNISCYSQ